MNIIQIYKKNESVLSDDSLFGSYAERMKSDKEEQQKKSDIPMLIPQGQVTPPQKAKQLQTPQQPQQNTQTNTQNKTANINAITILKQAVHDYQKRYKKPNIKVAHVVSYKFYIGLPDRINKIKNKIDSERKLDKLAHTVCDSWTQGIRNLLELINKLPEHTSYITQQINQNQIEKYANASTWRSIFSLANIGNTMFHNAIFLALLGLANPFIEAASIPVGHFLHRYFGMPNMFAEQASAGQLESAYGFSQLLESTNNPVARYYLQKAINTHISNLPSKYRNTVATAISQGYNPLLVKGLMDSGLSGTEALFVASQMPKFGAINKKADASSEQYLQQQQHLDARQQLHNAIAGNQIISIKNVKGVNPYEPQTLHLTYDQYNKLKDAIERNDLNEFKNIVNQFISGSAQDVGYVGGGLRGFFTGTGRLISNALGKLWTGEWGNDQYQELMNELRSHFQSKHVQNQVNRIDAATKAVIDSVNAGVPLEEALKKSGLNTQAIPTNSEQFKTLLQTFHNTKPQSQQELANIARQYGIQLSGEQTTPTATPPQTTQQQGTTPNAAAQQQGTTPNAAAQQQGTTPNAAAQTSQPPQTTTQATTTNTQDLYSQFRNSVMNRFGFSNPASNA